MKDRQIVAQVFLNEDETLQKVKRLRKKEPNYYRIGNGTLNKHGIYSMDLIEEMVHMSQPARTMLGWIKDGIEYDPYDQLWLFIVKITPANASERKIVERGYKELHDRNLVRRVKRSHYMINPNALIIDYKRQLEVWESLD